MTMDDMLAIVKPHNDRIVAEGRANELQRKLDLALGALRDISNIRIDDDANVNRVMLHCAVEVAKNALEH